MITVIYPFDIDKVWMSCTWQGHLDRPGYNRAYAGVDFAGNEQPLWACQYNGKVLQAMWSTAGYGYTVFMEHYDRNGDGVLRIRTAHQKNLKVAVGDIVQPGTLLGTMDSTGNSTGTHVHWEVWIRKFGVWQNIDPLAPENEINIVASKDLLEPIDGSDIPVTPEFTIPDTKFTPCKNVIYDPIRLRTLPYVSTTARIIGQVNPGETWYYCGNKIDALGNIWFALRKNDKIGWSAAKYGGKDWIIPQE